MSFPSVIGKHFNNRNEILTFGRVLTSPKVSFWVAGAQPSGRRRSAGRSAAVGGGWRQSAAGTRWRASAGGGRAGEEQGTGGRELGAGRLRWAGGRPDFLPNNK